MINLVGIDEVGRGPLAGPVAVGAVAIKVNLLVTPKFISYDISYEMKRLFKGVRDSKKLSPSKRKEIFKKVQQAQKCDLLRYIVVGQSSKVIDRKGISFAIQSCINKCLRKLDLNPRKTIIFLDGGLKAPKEFIYQKTIIRGDDKKKIISLASIVTKVSRDELMSRLSKKYPEYGFEKNVGYGTGFHRRAIKKFGLSEIHRKSYCRKIK